MEYSPFIQDEPFIISVSGGKQGTGKSLISTNMAIQMANAGLRVLLIDHDLGNANMQNLYNLANDETPISQDPRNKLANFLLEEGVPNLLMIPGANFGLDFTNISTSHKVKFFNQIKEISSADIVIIDLGGSATEQTLDIFLMAHAGLIITTPEPASIVNSYEFLKKVVYRTIFRMFRKEGKLQTIVDEFFAAAENGGASVAELAEQLKKVNPWAAKNLLGVCKEFDFYFILNEARNPDETQLATKLHDICAKYLSIDLNYVGMLLYDRDIPTHTSVMAPLSITHPDSISCKTINSMAGFIINHMIHRHNNDSHHIPFEKQYQIATEKAEKSFAASQG